MCYSGWPITRQSNSTMVPQQLTKGQNTITNEIQNDEKKGENIRPKAPFYICWCTSLSPFPSLFFVLFQSARRLAQLAQLQSEWGSNRERDNEKERRGSQRAKWLVGFRQWIGIDSPGRGCLYSVDGFNKGPTTLVREGHETSADIILCLPPVPNNWGSGLKDPTFVRSVICHLPLEM